MKKLIAIVLAIVLLIIICLLLTSCGERVRYHEAGKTDAYFTITRNFYERG